MKETVDGLTGVTTPGSQRREEISHGSHLGVNFPCFLPQFRVSHNGERRNGEKMVVILFFKWMLFGLKHGSSWLYVHPAMFPRFPLIQQTWNHLNNLSRLNNITIHICVLNYVNSTGCNFFFNWGFSQQTCWLNIFNQRDGDSSNNNLQRWMLGNVGKYTWMECWETNIV